MTSNRSEVDSLKLYQYAGKEAAALLSELFDFLDYLHDHNDAKMFYDSMEIPAEPKISLIKETFVGKSKMFYDLIILLIHEGLISSIEKITREFQGVLADEGKVEFGQLISAHPLPENIVNKIKIRLESLSEGKKIQLRAKTNPALLGGFELVFREGRMLDGSLAGRISQLKKELVK